MEKTWESPSTGVGVLVAAAKKPLTGIANTNNTEVIFQVCDKSGLNIGLLAYLEPG